MFVIQPEVTRSRPQLHIVFSPETKPMLKAIWENVDGQLVCRWIKA